MATFNGHKNWNHWNVSLWINNDVGLYILAKRCAQYRPVELGTRVFLRQVGASHTPDGAPYSKSSVRAALANI